MSNESQDGVGRDPVVVEVWVDQTVYKAALSKVRAQGESVAGVARASLFTAAAEAVAVDEPDIKPREYGVERERIRFKVPADTKKDAVSRIEASGESVPAAIERYLRRYVDRGSIVNN